MRITGARGIEVTSFLIHRVNSEARTFESWFFDESVVALSLSADPDLQRTPMSRPELPDVFLIRDEQLPVVAHRDAEGTVEP